MTPANSETPANPSYEDAMAILEDALVFGIDPSLDGMHAMCAALGNPQQRYRCIQIAGTNGKTSTSRTIARILIEHGYKVGLYTSPELVRYPERYEIDAQVIDDALFARGIMCANEVAETVKAAGTVECVTEFELLTVAALQIFADEQVDFAVLECGMGGRWDATSVVMPEVAVVTGIGLDHTHILGDTLEAIAGEKAAIVKPGCKAVFGPGTLQPEVLPVMLEQARDSKVQPRLVYERDTQDDWDLALLGDDIDAESLAALMDEEDFALDTIANTAELGYDYIVRNVPEELLTSFAVTQDWEDGAETLAFDVAGALADYGTLRFDQPRFQAANVSTAIAACEATLERPLDAAAVQRGLDRIVFPGRFETLREEPLLIIDAAHNPESAQTLARTIRRRFDGPCPVLLLAVLADKDAAGIIDELAPLADRIVVTQTSSHRALPVADLAALVESETGVAPQRFATPAEAVEALSAEGAAVVASGSITLAGAVKALFL